MTPEELIAFLNLERLPQEGGYFRELYRSSTTIPQSALPDGYDRDKVTLTSIYYLLIAGIVSGFHRLPSDETYHFYMGDPVDLTLLNLDGTVTNVVLGSDIFAGQHLQFTVPKGVWQASVMKPGGAFALMGCTVAPGFDQVDYEQGHWETLLRKFPAQHAIIMKLTKK